MVAGVENTRVAATYDGRPAVVLDIQRQPGANIVQTVEAVKQQLPRLRRAMPSGIRLTIVSDRTETIRASVRDVQFTLILSVRAGRRRDLRVPAVVAGHHHSGDRFAAVA